MLNDRFKQAKSYKLENVSKVIFQTPSPLRGTPSINRGRVEILPFFGKSHQLLLCL